MSNFEIKSMLAAALFAGSVSVAVAAESNMEPIGELSVRGQAQVTSGDSSEAVPLRNTTYRWFSGDRVSVRGDESRAVLALDDGNSFGFGSGADVRLARDASGALTVDLEAGTFLYAIDEDLPLTVHSGDYVFRTRDDEPRMRAVSRDGATVTGLIERTADGDVRVSVHQGELVARHVSGDLQYQVVSGESIAFDGAEPRMVQVQAMAARPQDDDDGNIGAWIANNPVPFGLTLIMSGVLAERFVIADRDGPEPAPPPVSP